MAKASKSPKSKITVHSDANTEEFATKVFAKSGYPKTIKENIKVVLNVFVNFLC